jgi:RNA polymerase sigma-70 factor, ECF subfamily
MSVTITSPPASGDPAQTGDRFDVMDDDVLRALYKEHAGPVLGYALRLTGDRQRAEDIVQETMLRAWRHPEAIAPGRGSLRPWLFTVARNLVIDNARARTSRPVEVGQLCLATAGTDDNLDSILIARDVAAAIRTLSPSHREVVVQTYFLGKTLSEAAESLGVPIGTVKSRCYYALRALRLALEERGITN